MSGNRAYFEVPGWNADVIEKHLHAEWGERRPLTGPLQIRVIVTEAATRQRTRIGPTGDPEPHTFAGRVRRALFYAGVVGHGQVVGLSVDKVWGTSDRVQIEVHRR